MRNTTHLLYICLFSFVGASEAQTNHQFKIVLNPSEPTITIEDTITLPEGTAPSTSVEFLLNSDFSVDTLQAINVEHPQNEMLIELQKQSSIPAKIYRLSTNDQNRTFKIKYHGRLGLTNNEKEDIPGLFTSDGIYLARSALWFPVFSDDLVGIDMTIDLPANWEVISQGARNTRPTSDKSRKLIQWKETKPQDDIYFVAGPYTYYESKRNAFTAQVFLRSKDDELARRYLEATHRYVSLYSDLLGPYPYAKFAMVENFWETGFGMPSFTLLGSSVLRLPFILYSSYPHEILHNWWGNSVYVDYSQGNWSEGLTTYLADHLFKEQRGEQASYRRDLLQRYSDYISSNNDFPLTQFVWRHNAQAEAVGYGKTMMMFHMLRSTIGDEAFLRGLREIYLRFRFKPVGYDDFATVFSEVSNQNLQDFFKEWTQRTGAPQLEIPLIKFEKYKTGYKIAFDVAQRQSQQPFMLTIPVYVLLENSDQAFQTQITLDKPVQRFQFEIPGKPVALALDPLFDVFRRVDDSEVPPALTQGFGSANNYALITPNDTVDANAYTDMFKTWQENEELPVTLIQEDEISSLPNKSVIWITGWNSAEQRSIQFALEAEGVKFSKNTLTVNGKAYSRKDHTFVFTLRHPDRINQTVIWIATENSGAIPLLTRKLPHYRKFSYVAFQGDAMTNVDKGQWTVRESLLIKSLDRKNRDVMPYIPKLPPLITE